MDESERSMSANQSYSPTYTQHATSCLYDLLVFPLQKLKRNDKVLFNLLFYSSANYRSKFLNILSIFHNSQWCTHFFSLLNSFLWIVSGQNASNEKRIRCLSRFLRTSIDQKFPFVVFFHPFSFSWRLIHRVSSCYIKFSFQIPFFFISIEKKTSWSFEQKKLRLFFTFGKLAWFFQE